MLSRSLLTLVLVSITSGMVACDGCASGSGGKAQPQADGPTRDPPAVLSPEMLNPLAGYRARAEDLGPFDGSMLRYAGEFDFKNRYSSVVMVTTGDPSEGAQCSGVLLGPRLALTSGSCVCQPSPATSGSDGGRIIDASTCAGRASVVTVVYGKMHDEHTADMEALAYEGVVRPHPGLKVLLDARSSVVTSHADLAVIFLETPVENGAAYAGLADSEVVADEFLVTAGYGHDETIEQAFGERYVRRNKVAHASSSGDEGFAYVPSSVDVHDNHGGWPCFREKGRGRWLVGITSMDLETGKDMVRSSLFTSTFVHRGWINQQLEKSTARIEKLKSQND